jgi:chromosomal replication initiation ATPase DnaA
MSVDRIIEDLDTRDALELALRIAKEHGITVEELLGRSHRAPPARARHELWSRLYEEAIPSLSALSRVFERDRTTIRAGIHQHVARQAKLATSPTSSPFHAVSEEGGNACPAPR